MEDGVRSVVSDVGDAGLALRTGWVFLRRNQRIAQVAQRAERIPVDRHGTVRTDARVGRAKEDSHRLAVDVVVAGIKHRGRSDQRRKWNRTQGAAKKVVLVE